MPDRDGAWEADTERLTIKLGETLFQCFPLVYLHLFL